MRLQDIILNRIKELEARKEQLVTRPKYWNDGEYIAVWDKLNELKSIMEQYEKSKEEF